MSEPTPDRPTKSLSPVERIRQVLHDLASTSGTVPEPPAGAETPLDGEASLARTSKVDSVLTSNGQKTAATVVEPVVGMEPGSATPDPSVEWSDVSSGQTDPTEKFSPVAASPKVSIAGYEILGILGRGGMGVVYKARQLKLNRIVALKMVHGPGSADSRELARFLVEAEEIAAIEHPNVVQIYEVGEHEGRPFLALEYLEGGSLAERLQAGGKLEPRTAVELVGKIARGVRAAHEKGIIHRDLKPHNVLFDAAGEPRVTDFGIAKRTSADLTQTNAVLGTPAYVAPEQAKGETRFVAPAADTYALGVILYECLTNSRPFDATDPLILLRKVIEEQPESPRRRVPGLPRDLELICLKCLAKDPSERYPTAQALIDDLDRFATGKPVAAVRMGAFGQLSRWARRNPTVAGLSSFAIVLLVASSIVSGVLAYRASRAAEQARIATEERDQALRQQRKELRRFVTFLIEAKDKELTDEQKVKLVTRFLDENPDVSTQEFIPLLPRPLVAPLAKAAAAGTLPGRTFNEALPWGLIGTLVKTDVQHSVNSLPHWFG